MSLTSKITHVNRTLVLPFIQLRFKSGPHAVPRRFRLWCLSVSPSVSPSVSEKSKPEVVKSQG